MADNESRKPNKEESIGIETGLETNVITNDSARRYKWIFAGICGVLALLIALNVLGVFRIAPHSEDDPEAWYNDIDTNRETKATEAELVGAETKAQPGEAKPTESVSAGLDPVETGEVKPEGTKAEPAPEGTKAEPAPEGTKAEPAPEGTKAEPALEGTKAEPVPEGTKAEPAPEDTKAEPAPEDTKAEPTPEGTKAEPVPEGTKAEPVPEDTKAEPVPEGTKAEPKPAGPVAIPANAKKGATFTATDKDGQLSVVVTLSDQWGEGNAFTKYDMKLNNASKKDLSDWVIELTFAKAPVLDQSWSGTFSPSGNKLIVSPVDYNRTVMAGQSPDVGFIVNGTTLTEITSVSIGKAVASVNQNPQNQNQNNQNQNNQNQNNQNQPKQNPGKKEVPALSQDDWLSVSGNQIVDAAGNPVWLTGCNWFGYNTGTNTFDGLWACDLNSSLAAIADHGFNLLRVPISAELILQWKAGKAPSANFNNATNSYLVGMNSLEIWDYVVGQCHANGLKILIDIHSAKTDAMGHMKPLWVDGNIAEKDYLDALAWMADRYKNDDTIVAYDLKNEPHGKPFESEKAIWNDSKDANNWKYIAEKAANAVLSKNPNVLVLVEGIEIYPIDIKKNGNYASTNEKDYFFNWWGGNLRGVKDAPVNLGKYQNKLVYSPHDYGPSVYKQPWFDKAYTFDTLMKDCWMDNWFYIHKQNIAPLLIGEWGGFMTEPNLTWMTHLRRLIKENKLHHTFWCFNSNSGDTGGLVLDDFKTWDEAKYKFVKEVLWQKGGKFVGLDHKIPLGENGLTLTQGVK